MSVLLPLHELLNSGVKTPNEVAFQKAFGKDLEKAWNCCKVSPTLLLLEYSLDVIL